MFSDSVFSPNTLKFIYFLFRKAFAQNVANVLGMFKFKFIYLFCFVKHFLRI